jgi:hypothetical protein
VIWWVWRVTLSTRPDLFFAKSDRNSLALADGCGLKQGRDPLESPLHTHVGVYDGIDFMMVRTGVHDQNLRAFVGLLDHIGQVMAIILGQRSAKDYEVESIATEGFLNGLAVWGCGYLMSGLFHFASLNGKSGFIQLAVKNLDRMSVTGLMWSCGQWAS